MRGDVDGRRKRESKSVSAYPPARQVCLDSEASMPCKREGWVPILSVSPSVTVARPEIWALTGPATTTNMKRGAAAPAMNDACGPGRYCSGGVPREA